jgi:hypothetical protein
MALGCHGFHVHALVCFMFSCGGGTQNITALSIAYNLRTINCNIPAVIEHTVANNLCIRSRTNIYSFHKFLSHF